ncbi:MAG: DUF2809 domain-containing protein [Clostridiales bacterium]|nr:DUF2809 domain-containing protein [Clostridiales bacterium]
MVNSKKKEKIKNLLYFLFFLIIEILIALFIHDNFIRPYIGDVLVIFVIFFFIKIFLNKENKLLPIYILLFAIVVEIIQGLNFIDKLSINNKIIRIILGSTFDIKDILCYVVGAIILCVYQYKKVNSKLK